jgi:RNA 2',3'-cyclic 3'-phosphodiesterase
MRQRLRTFIAVAPDTFTHDRLVGLQQRLAEAGVPVKWVEPDNLHLTLLFLGEVHAREIPAICSAVEQVCRTAPPFAMTLAGAGAFPTPRRPRTLIVHVTEGADELRALHDALERPLLELGCYRREERAYTPHMTLGRVKATDDPAALSAAVQQFAKWQGGQTQVREVLVMSSELRADGPEYTVLARARLKNPE